jgi:hypothetical protein
MTHDDFRRLWPNAWFNDKIVNTYVSLLDAHTPDDSLWFALLSFIIFLQVMIPRLRAASPNDRPTDAMYRLT